MNYSKHQLTFQRHIRVYDRCNNVNNPTVRIMRLVLQHTQYSQLGAKLYIIRVRAPLPVATIFLFNVCKGKTALVHQRQRKAHELHYYSAKRVTFYIDGL